MNLNADAGEDITFDHLFTEKSDQLDLVDHTDQINPNQPNKETTVIVNTDNQSDPVRPSANELFGSPLIKNELPNFNAEFIDVTKNSYNNTSDLIEVYNGLVQTNGVSKEDISLIDSISPGFINDRNHINYYTEEKSKTQYKKALESLDKEIDARIGIIAQASIDYLDKAHEKYSVLIPALQESVIDKIMSLQLEVQQLSLKVNKEDKDINDILETTIGRAIVDEDKAFSELPNSAAKALVELSAVFTPSFSGKLSALFFSQLNTEDQTWFTIGDNREMFSVRKEEPYFDVCQTKDSYHHYYVHSLHIHTALVTGISTLGQIKTLCGAAIGVISGFPKYKEDIKSISSSVDKPKNVILDELYCVSSGNAKDALVVLNIVNFLESFICYLDKLKNVYSAISSNQTNVATESKKERAKKYKLAKEGFFDLIKRKSKDQEKTTLNTNKNTSLEKLDLSDLSNKYRNLLDKLQKSNETTISLRLNFPDKTKSLSDLTNSMTVLLEVLTTIKVYYTKIPKILDNAHSLITSFVSNPSNNPEKFMDKVAGLYSEIGKAKNGILSNSTLVKSFEVKDKTYVLRDRNHLFEITTRDENLVENNPSISNIQKIKQDLISYQNKISIAPILNVLIFTGSKRTIETIEFKKSDVIRFITNVIKIAEVLNETKSLIDLLEGTGSLKIGEKAEKIYKLDDSVYEIEDSISINDFDVTEFVQDLIFYLGSWTEDNDFVKYEEHNYNVLISLIDDIDIVS